MKLFNLHRIDEEDQVVVSHSGIITKISDNVVTVSLSGDIHCEACHAKGGCGMSETTAKKIDVYDTTQQYKLNEQVVVHLRKNIGLKAVFWAYLFPFLIVIATLSICASLWSEWLAGLLSILVLIPYYLILSLLKNSFKKTFAVSIKKQVHS